MPDATLVVLLAVHNGAAALPGFLASAARYADAIVALDEGSSDATRDLLAAHPLVQRLLTTPRRGEVSDRDRLLAAAAELGAAWLLVLEVDERIPAEDAAALRAFLARDALPGCAYGLKAYRMWEDLAHYDRAGPWLYRLFAVAAGQQFPDPPHYFSQVPTSIPPALWLRTTLRIQDLASLTVAQRQARLEETRQFESASAPQSYHYLLERVGPRREWVSRPAALPVLASGGLPGPAPSPSAAPREEDGTASQNSGSPAIQLWSGGKDSAFALWVSRQRGTLDIQALLTIIVDGPDRTNWHGVRTALMHRQAAAVGLPLFELRISDPDVDVKLEAIGNFLSGPQAAPYTTVVWGDLYFDAARSAHADISRAAGKEVEFPLWNAETGTLAQAIMAAGFEAVVTAVASWGNGLSPNMAGRKFDDSFLAGLPAWADPCGEGGEFHTFAYDGPIFTAPVAFEPVGLIYEDPYYLCDLAPRD